ncbi:Ivy family c-type lysozyme inhibitor [Ottowia cancrivicina]|uniref:Ivy family c-type lysozyme inhibitor n=1 Tax=Ottowia cancrivicina TaxID=3040346 RepID=A0AAW6RK85_9BURK|nr:Ivy family c-type lysozyme inhibitor [Ottowia sp. 10c7w1]MDG9698262.1 Ivy family c-type lysozyme inhibitor [Ottowia sp. 10c7w1]
MKTRLATLTACVAAIALLSGCFGSAEKAPAPQPEAQPAQTQSAPEPAAEPAAAEPEGPYLYNLLEDQPAKKAWARMTASRKGAPAWIRKGEGPTSPAEEALINGKRYWQGSVCEQHNCPNTFFFLLGETKAYGLHANFANDKPAKVRPVYYGAPPAAEKAALREAFEAERERQMADE